jgi:NADH-quinone oxidoreductase subunit C
MTKPIGGQELAQQIREHFPEAVLATDETSVIVSNQALFEVMRFLKETLDFDYLVAITAVDYSDYFEVIYQSVSIEHNYSSIIKTRCYERESPTLPSVTSLWQGADFQEREIYDLIGIYFSGHPNMKRIFLWEGFQGHPLRRDYQL